jgi:hypothetical protein
MTLSYVNLFQYSNHFANCMYPVTSSGTENIHDKIYFQKWKELAKRI